MNLKISIIRFLYIKNLIFHTHLLFCAFQSEKIQTSQSLLFKGDNYENVFKVTDTLWAHTTPVQ